MKESRFSGRQITAMVIAVCAAAVLTPVGVAASTGSLVTIADGSHSAYRAQVSPNGNLAVTPRDAKTGSFARVDSGSLRVDGTVHSVASGGTQAVKGTVNVGNFPSTQPVSGTVSVGGSLPAGTNNIGHVTVDNFPSTQQVAGSTSILSSGSLTLIAGSNSSSGYLDTSTARSVRIYAYCQPQSSGDCPNTQWVVWAQIPGIATFQIDSGNLSDYGVLSRLYDVPGTVLLLEFYNNNSFDAVTIDYAVEGRTN